MVGVMSRETADALFGEGAVARALAEKNTERITRELASEVERRADPPGALRAWALSLPWPRFCAVVHIISGEVRREAERAHDGQ